MRRKFELLGLASVCGALFFPACANDASCDEGEEVVQGSCVPLTADPPDSGTPGQAGAAGAGGASALQAPDLDCDPADPATGSFGQACSDGETSSDCGCPAPICAIRPGESSGFCTQIGCDLDPSLCPSGFDCFDLSAIDPTFPHTCLPN